MNEGWIKLYRRITDHWIWENDRYLKWWLDILMQCNHESKRFPIGNTFFDCNRGESLHSLETWAKRWGVDKSTTRRFLKLLETDNMIVLKNETVTTRITICNYEDYQEKGNAVETDLKRKKNANESEKTPNKNEKNTKNEKKEGEGTDDLSIDVSNTPGTEVYILPQFLRLDYLAVQKFCFGCSLASMKDMDPQNYETLREKFSHEQIMSVLGEMANTPKIEKDYKSVYLTCNNWLKRDYGKPENMKLAEDMEAVYRVFVKAKANSEPKIDKYERTALNSLADYLTKNSTLKNSDGAMLSWNYILTNWGNMDAFMQNRIKLVEIEKDIIKILKTQRDAANNGHNSTKVTKEDTGGKKAFD